LKIEQKYIVYMTIIRKVVDLMQIWRQKYQTIIFDKFDPAEGY